MEKEKSILFNTEMVRAILDGRKATTRRIIKRQGKYTPDFCGRDKFYKLVDKLNYDKHLYAGFYCDNDIFEHEGKKQIDALYWKAPYQPGDVLWIRETWFHGDILDSNEDIVDSNITLYRADRLREDIDYELMKWRPSIFMPKKLARIFLKVTGVKVQRLQDMTDEEAWKEGNMVKPLFCQDRNCNDCKHATKNYKGWGDCYEGDCQGARHYFKSLWDSLYEKKGYGWDINPWVWVIEFERIDS